MQPLSPLWLDVLAWQEKLRLQTYWKFVDVKPSYCLESGDEINSWILYQVRYHYNHFVSYVFVRIPDKENLLGFCTWHVILLVMIILISYPSHSQVQNVRISSIIIFHLSKLWKPKFFILYDVIFLVRLQGKFEIIYNIIDIQYIFHKAA